MRKSTIGAMIAIPIAAVVTLLPMASASAEPRPLAADLSQDMGLMIDQFTSECPATINGSYTGESALIVRLLEQNQIGQWVDATDTTVRTDPQWSQLQKGNRVRLERAADRNTLLQRFEMRITGHSRNLQLVITSAEQAEGDTTVTDGIFRLVSCSV